MNRQTGRLSPRWEIVALVAILLVGAGLRVAYLAELVRDPTFSSPAFDAHYHDYWAWGLVSGDWSRPMGLDDPRIERTPFFRPPAYPYFLAGVYAVFGHDYLAARVVQFALGLVSVVLVHGFTRRWFGPSEGLVAAALAATYWIFLFFEGELLAPVVLVPLVLGALATLAGCAGRPSAGRIAAAGLLLGLATLARPNVLAFVPVAALWLAWVGRRRGTRRAAGSAALVVAVAAAVVVPAAIRNYRASGEWVWITANAGINLWIGNNPEADGTTPAIPDLEALTGDAGWTCFDYPNVVRGLSRHLDRPLSYKGASEYWAAKAGRFILDRPVRFLELCAKRAALFWGPSEVGNNRDVHFARRGSVVLRAVPVTFPVVLALAVTGGALLWTDLRRRPDDRARERMAIFGLVTSFVGVYFLSFVPFFFAARYRVPVIPFLMMLGAYAIVRVVRSVRGREVRRVTITAAGLVGVLLVASVNWAGYEPNPEQWHYARGAAFGQQGRLDLAVREYRRALELDPRHSLAHNNLGLALIRLGRGEEGIAHLRAALEINPNDPRARFNLGGMLFRMGRLEEGVEQYERGLALDPVDPHAHVNLGVGLLHLDRLEEAGEHLRRAAEIQPREPRAHANLGRVLLRQNRPEEAAAALARAAQLDPANASVRFWLGRASEARGDLEEARRQYRRALASRPTMREAERRLRALETP